MSEGALHRRSLPLELACFAALAFFAAREWAALVHEPPMGRAALAVAIATAAGLALAALAQRSPRPRAARALAAGIAAAAVLLAAVAIGLPADRLWPGNWDELVSSVGASLGGVADVALPYDGGDEWTRLAILLAAPLLVGVAAALAFWPWGERGPRRMAALILLVGLLLLAMAWRTPGGEVGRGLVLALLVAAWLWLPRLPADRAAAAARAVGAAVVVAVPLAAWLGPGKPLLDYRDWSLLSAGEVTFSWDEQSYGPLDWPQRGTPMLRIESDDPHYWKVSTLDSFDGAGWRRSVDVGSSVGVGSSGGAEPALGRPSELQDGTSGQTANLEWIERIFVDVRGLRTDIAVGAGTTMSLRGIEGDPSPDATWSLGSDLHRGDDYGAIVYVPEPTAGSMRAAPARYPSSLERYTAFSLPGEGAGRAPFWGTSGGAEVADRVAGGPYEQTYDLARGLTASSATPYDAARAIEDHLRSGYAYDQDVPEHAYPLSAFLFEDRRGYCQQFSGAMALMLRMVGIPARVATGFTPGAQDRDAGTFLVEDTDAHAWVEVFFPGTGWVPFEPTPAAAPAESQLGERAAAAAIAGSDDGNDGAEEAQPPAPAPTRDEEAGGASGTAAAPGPGEGSGPPTAAIAAVGLAGLLVAGGAYAVMAVRRARRARNEPDALAGAQLGELRTALARLDEPVPEGATLLELERRLARIAGPAGPAYAAKLRERRFRRPSAPPPSVADRRALRRSLLADAGWRGAPRVLAAIAPGGPRA